MATHDENKMTVLIVDDEPDVRDVLELSLVDSGYTVLTNGSGVEALAEFKERNPQIVLTDIKMPNMDGIELLRNIKRENPETEVIMITGHGDMHLAIESLKNDAADFITKPINVEALEISLKRACERIVMRRKLRSYTESLEQMILEKSALQDHLASLGLMLSAISHAIKGMLTGLDGGLYLLNSGFNHKDRKQIDEGRNVIALMVEKIRKMVLDILFHAKKRELKLETVDLKAFTTDVLRAVLPKAKDLGIRLDCRIDPALEKAVIDPGFVSEALINILENAVDACIKDTGKKDHRITFRVELQKDQLHIVVADNGVGMDADTREKIFTLFFSSKGRRGTGLGLFISEKNIQQHGGSITVTSKPGKGSTFKIKIPNR